MQGVSHTQPYCQTASSPESSSSFSSSTSDEDEAVESVLCEQTKQAVTLQWTTSSCPQSSVAHTYTGGSRGKDNEASHTNDGSSPLSVFLLYFAEIITLLVVETNRYYHDYLDRYDDGPSPDPEVNEAEMFLFLALTIQMGHGVTDKTDRLQVSIGSGIHIFLRHYDEPGRYLHILRYLHFTDNRNKRDRTDENFDRLWKIRDPFEILNDTFSKFYNHSKNLAIDKVIVPIKGRVIFKQYIPKKTQAFWHQNVQTL